jgi:eukaryotic-like serine/threonine-protein kinase
MRGALEHHAEATISALKIPKETLRDVLLAMTTPEGTRAPVKLDVLVQRFGEPAREAVVALRKAHLLVEERSGVTFVHDSVLREWSLIRGWLEAARDDRLLLAHLERDATRWADSKDPAELWRKGRLAAAFELWKRGDLPLSDSVREFLRKSHSAEQRTMIAFWSLAILVVTLIVGGSLFYANESRDREAQARKDAAALAAALAEVKVLKQQADENAGEAAASASLLADLQKKMAEERANYGAHVQATLHKVASATSLDGAQKATEDLKARGGPAQNQVVPLPMDLSGLSGPGVPKAGDGSPSAGGGTFDQGAIERVVNSRKAGVKRTCLERSASTASSTKVTATITIGPNGTVQNVSSASDQPAVAKCIEQQLRSWSFPPPGEVKQVQIPFVFVRQG